MSLLRRGAGAVTDFVEVLRQVRTDEIAAEAEQHFEIAVVGAPGAGKTTLINHIASGTFGGLLEPLVAERLAPGRPPPRRKQLGRGGVIEFVHRRAS